MNPYKLIFAFGRNLALLPFPVLYLFSEVLAFLVWHVFRYRKKVALTNLRHSFPEWTGKEIRRTARRFYRHFADQVLEAFKVFHLDEKQILKRVHFTNPELLEEYYKAGKSVILATAHYGNWEWLVSLPLITEYHVLVVYKPPRDKRSDYVYERYGSRYGGDAVKLPALPRTLLKHSANKEQTATFLVADQGPVREHIRHWNTLLNQPTPWNEGIDRLAKKTGQPVIYIQLEKLRRGNYQITFHPLCQDAGEAAPHEITDAFTARLESSIRARPELWLWTHRRWKLKREKEAGPQAG